MTVKAKVDAIDRFVRTLKSGGLYDDIGSAAIMAGWTNLAGALYPLKGAAPTNNGFLAADLDAGIGLKGDGSTKWLDSNRATNADGQDDRHLSVYASVPATPGIGMGYIGEASGWTLLYSRVSPPGLIGRLSSQNSTTVTDNPTVNGFLAGNRSNASTQEFLAGGNAISGSVASAGTGGTAKTVVFWYGSGTKLDATLSWYSIGTATDLAALDSAVSTLMADLRAIDEDGFDRDALAYIRAVEAADGSYLETGVKQAINSFIVGLKKDNLWNAIKASCILCGARTIAGALVPLAGTAPTALGGWASGDYNRETGLIGNGSTKYLDTNRASNADSLTDLHFAAYASSAPTSDGFWMGASEVNVFRYIQRIGSDAYLRDGSNAKIFAGAGATAGFAGLSRQDSGQYSSRVSGSTQLQSSTPYGSASTLPMFLFARNYYGSASNFGNARLAFYSVGAAIDLAALDARVSTLVSQIAAAIP